MLFRSKPNAGRPGKPAVPAGQEGLTALQRRQIANGKLTLERALKRNKRFGTTPKPPAAGGPRSVTGPPVGSQPPGAPAVPGTPALPPSVGGVFPVLQDPLLPKGMPPTTAGPAPFSGVNGGYNPGDFNDPFASYLAAIPGMQDTMNKQISGAMANAGFSGNRYGTSSERKAGEIGAETAMKMNSMLTDTLFNQANRDQDRQLAAAGMANTAGMSQDQLAQNRLGALNQYGMWEQGRQDNFSGQAREQFNQDRLGTLPMLLQAAMSQGAGNPGTPYQTTTGGTQPKIPPELLSTLFGLFT